MSKEEQKELSDYIKSVHLSLRCRSRRLGAELAWKQHVENEQVLKNYAVCMKKLAENFWTANNRQSGEKLLCRIQWMIDAIREYFESDGLAREILKERNRTKNFLSKSLMRENEVCDADDFGVSVEFKAPYKLLDVGSCYDPFGAYDIFKTFPVDLCPADASVKKCDFTRLEMDSTIVGKDGEDWFRDDLNILPSNFFDIVVFSLFLEYLPSPEQRYLSCQKAYDSLKINGLLLIATPDSKHATANARIMKNWKIALARIGFVRIKIEKLKYLYCMAFRKAISKKYPSVLYNVVSDESAEIQIPQDFVDYDVQENLKFESYKNNENNTRKAFEELPFS